jgi:hypothetical protein
VKTSSSEPESQEPMRKRKVVNKGKHKREKIKLTRRKREEIFNTKDC